MWIVRDCKIMKKTYNQKKYRSSERQFNHSICSLSYSLNITYGSNYMSPIRGHRYVSYWGTFTCHLLGYAYMSLFEIQGVMLPILLEIF